MCVCVCVCVFPPGAAAGPSPLCAWRGLQAAQSTSKQPPRRCDPRPARTPPTWGFLFASFSGGGSRVALPVNKNLIKLGPMPEKQPKETEVQGGKLGRRPVGGPEADRTSVLAVQTHSRAGPSGPFSGPFRWGWGWSHSFGLGNWGFRGSAIHGADACT